QLVLRRVGQRLAFCRRGTGEDGYAFRPRRGGQYQLVDFGVEVRIACGQRQIVAQQDVCVSLDTPQGGSTGIEDGGGPYAVVTQVTELNLLILEIIVEGRGVESTGERTAEGGLGTDFVGVDLFRTMG